MEEHSCKGSKREQLYVLEIFVDRVTLFLEKMDKMAKTEPSSLGVDLRFADFPLFRIFQTQFNLTKEDRRTETKRESQCEIINFNSGKIHLSTQNPTELIAKMRSSLLAVDVYKIKGILNCPYEVLKDPLGETKVPIAGCLCDQVTMSSNDPAHLPKSYRLRSTYGLVDNGRPSGLISISLRLTCLGESVTNEYFISGKKLVFKRDEFPDEFLCTKVPLLDEADRKEAEEGRRICLPAVDHEETELDAPVRPVNVAGLEFACRELATSDEQPLQIRVQTLNNETENVQAETEASQRETVAVQQTIEALRFNFGGKPWHKGPCCGSICANGCCSM